MKDNRIAGLGSDVIDKNNSICWLVHESPSDTKPNIKHSAEVLSFIFRIFDMLLQFLLRIVQTAFALNHSYIELRGIERFSNQSISVAYIGDQISFHYISSLIFKASPDVVGQKSFNFWQLNKIINKYGHKADLAIVDISFPLTLGVKQSGFLLVPRWIMQRVTIAEKWQHVLGLLRRKTLREAQRMIRKYHYRARIIAGNTWGDDFYEQFYQPYITKRHGEAAVIASREQFTNSCKRGKIIQLVHNEKILGAALLLHAGNQLSIEWTGVAPEFVHKQKMGITDALDYFTLLYAYEQGYDFLDMGPSRASLNDGLVRYKSKWGAVVYRKKIPQGCLLIRPVRFSDAVSSVIINNRFISIEEGKLVSRVLIKEDLDANAIEKRIKNMWMPGLDRLLVFLQSYKLSNFPNLHPNIKIVTHKNLDRLHFCCLQRFERFIRSNC